MRESFAEFRLRLYFSARMEENNLDILREMY